MKQLYKANVVNRSIDFSMHRYITEHGIVSFSFSGVVMCLEAVSNGILYTRYWDVITDQPSIEGQMYVDRDVVKNKIKPLLDSFTDEIYGQSNLS